MKLFRPRFNQPSNTPDAELKQNPVRRYATCSCLDPQYKSNRWPRLELHSESVDNKSEAWLALEHYIQEVRAKRSEEFNPLDALGPALWETIITLPASIGTMKSVKVLELYGSHLVGIPPEIGGMENLEELDLYTSYCLHWLPYEITRCTKLNRSRISTRALYGNYKYRPPFPELPQFVPGLVPATCSVCDGEFSEEGPHQVWISLLVAKDVVPLLVNACSETCIERLPHSPDDYIQGPHRGGLAIKQPRRHL